MKGDGNIKKYTLNFLGVGYKNLYQLDLIIYDKKNNIIGKYQTYNGKVNVILKKNNIYKLNILFFNNNICIPIYLSSKEFISINLNSNNNKTITFLLTDYYYNLPIEKGELILWQK